MASNPNKAAIEEQAVFIATRSPPTPHGEAVPINTCTRLSPLTEDPDKQCFAITKTNANGDIISQQFDHNEFSKWILIDSGKLFVTLSGVTKSRDAILMYDDGVYKPGGYDWIIKRMEGIMDGHLCTTRTRAEVIGHVRANTTVDMIDFDTDDDIINMKNGLYSISGDELRPHTPDYLSVVQNGITYDPDATCPAIDAFFNEVMEPDRVEAGYEMMGYSLMPLKRMKTAVILLGPPNSGKGTYMRLLAEFVGADAVAEINISSMGEYTHSTESIIGKSVLRVDDLGNAPITDTGLLKSVISSERVHVNPKGGVQYDGQMNSFLIIGCNQLPTCSDKALMSKFDVIMFNHGRDNSECNVDLDNVLCAELSGLFNLSIAAGKRAVASNGFCGTNTLLNREKTYLYKSKPEAEFVDTELGLDDPNAEIEVKIVRKMYVEWCKERGLRPTAQKHMTMCLEEKGVMVRRVGSRGDQIPFYIGVDIKCGVATNDIDNDEHKHTKATTLPTNDDDVTRVRNAVMEIVAGNHTDAWARVKHISDKTGFSRSDVYRILTINKCFAKNDDGDWTTTE